MEVISVILRLHPNVVQADNALLFTTSSFLIFGNITVRVRPETLVENRGVPLNWGNVRSTARNRSFSAIISGDISIQGLTKPEFILDARTMRIQEE